MKLKTYVNLFYIYIDIVMRLRYLESLLQY